MTEELTLTRPDDWHLHLRDGAALRTTVPATANVFARAIVMPNLAPPITTVAAAEAYRARILEAIPRGLHFEPLMTLYLTDHTTPDDIRAAAESANVFACKLYPSGATTNSAAGVTNIDAIAPTLAAMEEHDLPLLLHGEATDPAVDVFDREKVFIDRVLAPLLDHHPALRVVFEHITTADAVQFVEESAAPIAATLTPQHLLMNRNDLFTNGLRPHNYCLPVLKRRNHQEALQRAATSANPRFFLGTDSAPHATDAKQSDHGCAGCYSAPHALPLYAHFFDSVNALDRLEPFASHFGPDFYRLPRNTTTITLRKQPHLVPDHLTYPDSTGITPYWAGANLTWQVV